MDVETGEMPIEQGLHGEAVAQVSNARPSPAAACRQASLL
jgi:hypothetical protein